MATKRAAGVDSAKAVNWAMILQLIKLLMDLFNKSTAKLDRLDMERIQTKIRDLRDALKG